MIKSPLPIFIDTHVAIWLYSGLFDRFEKPTIKILETSPLLISPILTLELQYLKEIGRISHPPQSIINELKNTLDLKIDNLPLESTIDAALKLTWTRDPFDRIMVATAIARNYKFLTKDKTILDFCSFAFW